MDNICLKMAVAMIAVIGLFTSSAYAESRDCIDGTDEDDWLQNLFIDNSCVRGKGGNDRISVHGDNNDVKGGDDNDSISVYGDNNDVKGGDGNDRINAYGYYNDVKGGDGNDIIGFSGTGNNVAIGGSGVDRVILDNSQYNVVELGDGDDYVEFDGGGSNNDVKGGDGDDYFRIVDETATGNIIACGGGIDTVHFVVAAPSNTIGTDCENIIEP